ncbi:MAG: fasciclin domain-containing protein [Cyclobacteriaceae bacterium]|jgi:transforming growth factor-beta-induced protein|nr:fasciclin domain-containing protein [Cyclobacteriaceae bacterium]
MKNRFQFLNISRLAASMMMIVFSVVFLASCDEDDNEAQPTQDIVALAQGNPNLSTLVAALTKYPDLVSTLQGSGQFTVFAPTNTAFASLLTAIGQTSLDDIPEDVLRDVLEYHVVSSAAVLSTQLTAGPVTTVGGEDITVSTSGGIRFNGTVSVTTADVRATNGVVHVIDAVLVPPSITPIVGTIVAPAFFNKNFTTLIAAVKAASPSVLTTLLSSTKKTLFAPTNAAFAAAGITTLPNRATLDAVLTYHVLGAEVLAAGIANGSSAAATANGKSIYLSKGTAGVFINGTTKVTTTDITASNGVVHVIDRTLLPPDKTIAQIATDFAGANPAQFTQLVAALVKVPALLDAAGAAGNLTVFAPTDAAFQSLYTALNVANMNELETKIGNAKLAQVLQHHIVGARVFSSDLSNGSVTTLNQNVTVSVTNLTITDAISSNPAAKLVPALLNVHATNGVIHVIDKVLIPQGIL